VELAECDQQMGGGAVSAGFGNKVSNQRHHLMQRALKLTHHNATAAEDLVQETICKALANEEQFVTGTNIRAWLYTILQNLFYEKYKKSKRLVLTRDIARRRGCGSDERDETDFVDEITNGTEPNQENDLYHKQICTAVNEALTRLPREQEIILRIWMRSGGGYADIVQLLEIPRGTAKSRVYRAQQNLRKIILALDSDKPIPQLKNAL